MLEIINKKKYVVQLLVRSKNRPRDFTCLNIPGVGSNKNVYHLAEERSTMYVEQAEHEGLISTKLIPNKLKGE